MGPWKAFSMVVILGAGFGHTGGATANSGRHESKALLVKLPPVETASRSGLTRTKADFGLLACRFPNRRRVYRNCPPPIPCWLPPISSLPPTNRPDSVSLRWKFTVKKAFYAHIASEVVQKMKVMGMEVTQNQSPHIWTRWTPERIDPKGNWVLAVKVLGTKLDVDIGGNKVSSENNPIGEVFKRAEFKVVLAPNLSIVEILGQEEYIRKEAGAYRQLELFLRSHFGEGAVKQMGEHIFQAVPERPVSKGDHWLRKNVHASGPSMGTYKTANKYTYEGQQGQVDHIKVESSLTYLTPKEQRGLPFQVEGTLKSPKDSSSGTVWFNRALGRVVRAVYYVRVEGTLGVDIGGLKTIVEMNVDQKTTVEITDTNPLDK